MDYDYFNKKVQNLQQKKKQPKKGCSFFYYLDSELTNFANPCLPSGVHL